jgi:ELWxxDGT repeat protein
LAALALVLTAGSLAADQLELGTGSSPSEVVTLGDAWYFTAVTPQFTGNLWRTDGTIEGTRPLTDFHDGNVGIKAVLGDQLYFFLDTHGAFHLYRTDGTAGGTRFIVDVPDHPYRIQASGSLLYIFSYVDDFTNHVAITRSDGTASGTYRLAEFGPGLSMNFGWPDGDLLFFELWHPSSGLELWRSDGSVAGTFKLTDGLGYYSSTGAMFGDLFLFQKETEVWSSDGTVAGTRRFLDTASKLLATTNHDAYFWAGGALKKMDVATGTMMVVKTITAPAWSVPDGDRLFFFGNSGPYSVGVTDGTADGTRVIPLPPFPLHNLAVFEPAVANGFVYFIWADERGTELWRSNGTAAGTAMVKDIARDPHKAPPSSLSVVAGRVLFIADDGIHGREPWITDGSTEGTRMIVNLYPEMTLRGTVTDAVTGAAVPDAIVRVWAKCYGYYCASDYSRDYAVDASGRYTVEGLTRVSYYSTPYYLTARTAGGKYIRQNWPAQDCFACEAERGQELAAVPGETRDGIDFALQRSGTFSGRITDASGAPVSGVRVVVAEAFGAEMMAGAFSGADGMYETRGPIPYDRPVLLYTTDAAGYSGVIYPAVSCSAGCTAKSTGTPLQVGIGERRSGIDFSVLPWGKIKGRVLDKFTGKKAVLGEEGLDVAFFYGPPPPVVVNDGEFTVALPDGRFHLLFRPPSGYRSTWFPDVPCIYVGCSPWSGYQTYGTAVTAIPGRTTEGYDVMLEPLGGRIEGRITAAGSGAPLGGIVVRVADDGGLGASTMMTDASGHYITPPLLLPGKYSVQTAAQAPWFPRAYGDGGKPCQPLACPGTHIEISGYEVKSGIDVELERFASVTGLVFDTTTGQPLRDAEITVRRGNDPAILADTNALGHYTASGLRTGTYVVTAAKRGWTTSRLAVTVVSQGTTLEWSLGLQPNCRPTGIPGKIIVPWEGISATIPANDCMRCPFSTSPFVSTSGCATGPVHYTVEPNTTDHPREATIVLPGETIVIRQKSARTITTF